MHPLMATILLWSACLNALVHDPELHPTKRELRQPQEPCVRKWCAVVRPDPRWHSVFPHRCFADRSDLAEIHTRDDLATNQITAVRVSNSERIAALAVASGEIAL